MAPGKWDQAGAGCLWAGGAIPFGSIVRWPGAGPSRGFVVRATPRAGAPALTTVLLTALVGAAGNKGAEPAGDGAASLLVLPSILAPGRNPHAAASSGAAAAAAATSRIICFHTTLLRWRLRMAWPPSWCGPGGRPRRAFGHGDRSVAGSRPCGEGRW
jgi:hypothetical protein